MTTAAQSRPHGAMNMLGGKDGSKITNRAINAQYIPILQPASFVNLRIIDAIILASYRMCLSNTYKKRSLVSYIYQTKVRSTPIPNTYR